MVVSGLECLLKDPKILKGKGVGLIANATSVDKGLISSVDLFHDHPDIDLKCVFGPQQGFFGETQDNMIEWRGGRHPKYDLPLYSLYGEYRKPTIEMLRDVDVLVFYVADVGTRVYTYIWTMALAMQACAEYARKFVVCDRPNPIGGAMVEGNVSSLDFSSFVALYPLPLRHGMTAGEIANYINKEFRIGCELEVVKLSGWKRQMWHDDTGLPWVIPSANMPTLDSATVFPGTVIFEGTNVSEGRGTTRPFEFVGAPFIDGFKLAADLSRRELPGVFFRPCVFVPTFHKHAGKNCGGVQLHVTDREKFLPVRTGLAMLKAIMDDHKKDFMWKDPPYEYERERLPIDVILGTDWIRKALEKGDGLDKILSRCDDEMRRFSAIRQKYLLY
jgi:uncharacterized protein YbbC (DUF1343 family)